MTIVIGLMDIFSAGGCGGSTPGKLVVHFQLLFAALRLQIDGDGLVDHLTVDSSAAGQLQACLPALNTQGLGEVDTQLVIMFPE